MAYRRASVGQDKGGWPCPGRGLLGVWRRRTAGLVLTTGGQRPGWTPSPSPTVRWLWCPSFVLSRPAGVPTNGRWRCQRLLARRSLLLRRGSCSTDAERARRDSRRSTRGFAACGVSPWPRERGVAVGVAISDRFVSCPGRTSCCASSAPCRIESRVIPNSLLSLVIPGELLPALPGGVTFGSGEIFVCLLAPDDHSVAGAFSC